MDSNEYAREHLLGVVNSNKNHHACSVGYMRHAKGHQSNVYVSEGLPPNRATKVQSPMDTITTVLRR